MNINKHRLSNLNKVPNLTYRASVLSNEGIGDVFKSISDFFSSKIESFVNIFRSNGDELKNMNFNGKQLFKLSKDINEIEKKYSFSTIRPIEVSTIMGLKVNLLDLTGSVNKGVDIINENLLKSLDELDSVVSKMLADEEFRKSVRKSYDFDYVMRAQIALGQIVEDVIDSKSTKEVFTVGELIPNVNSLNVVNKQLIDVNKKINEKTLKKVEEEIDKITEKVEALYEAMSDKDIDKASKQSLLVLSNGLEQVAKLITNSISVYYILMKENDTMVNTVKNIKQFARN